MENRGNTAFDCLPQPRTANTSLSLPTHGLHTHSLMSCSSLWLLPSLCVRMCSAHVLSVPARELLCNVLFLCTHQSCTFLLFVPCFAEMVANCTAFLGKIQRDTVSANWTCSKRRAKAEPNVAFIFICWNYFTFPTEHKAQEVVKERTWRRKRQRSRLSAGCFELSLHSKLEKGCSFLLHGTKVIRNHEEGQKAIKTVFFWDRLMMLLIWHPLSLSSPLTQTTSWVAGRAKERLFRLSLDTHSHAHTWWLRIFFSSLDPLTDGLCIHSK